MRQHIRLPAWLLAMAGVNGVFHCIPTSYQQQQLLHTRGVGRMSRRMDMLPDHRAFLHPQELSSLEDRAFHILLEYETNLRAFAKPSLWRQHHNHLP